MREFAWMLSTILLAGCSSESPSDTGGTTGTGGAAPVTRCPEYDDVAATSPVAVSIVNQRKDPIYLDGDCNILFDIVVNGVAHRGGLGPLRLTCEQAKSEPQIVGDCASPGMPIAPGETAMVEWSGLFFDETEMPAQCYPLGTAPFTCVQTVAAPAGPMLLAPRLFATSTNGGWPTVSDPISVQKGFVHGTDTMVEVIVQ